MEAFTTLSHVRYFRPCPSIFCNLSEWRITEKKWSTFSPHVAKSGGADISVPAEKAEKVSFTGGQRPKKYRVKNIRTKRGTVSKGERLVDCVTKWMLSKGQGKTLGNYFVLLNALAEEGRIKEAEELWKKMLMENLENMPRVFFARIISMYERNNMTEKLLEVFADMEELGIKPDYSTVLRVAKIFKELGMLDKYEKMLEKYPRPKWEYRYCKGKRVKRRLQISDYEDNLMKDNGSNTSNGYESTMKVLLTAEDTEQQSESVNYSMTGIIPENRI